MANANNLINQNSPDEKQTASLGDAEYAALINRLVEVENAIKAKAANAEACDKKQDAGEQLLDRVKTAERWMIGITILIFLVSVFQACESVSNNRATGLQVDQIIVAGQRLEDAGDSFSTSSANMSRSMTDAVGKLNLQAGATQEANTILLDSDRPYVGVSYEFSENSIDQTLIFHFVNGGKRPAVVSSTHVHSGFYVSFPKNLDRQYDKAANASQGYMVAGQHQTMGIHFLKSEDIRKRIEASGETFLAFGKIEYSDPGTKRTYYTHVCVRYDSTGSVSLNGFGDCPTYNDAK